MDYRQERRIIALQASVQEIKEQLRCRSAEDGIGYSIVPQDRIEALLSLRRWSLAKFAQALEQELFADNPLELLKDMEEKKNAAEKIDFMQKVVFEYFNVSKSSETSVWQTVENALNARARNTGARIQAQEHR
ncbi:unnamed protein product [Haemonchus placei]|uniref:Uncharacterized protein n=1 Tax=Haemonchus placei TaxID=6290 RepID=A0A0N4WUV9_HAEPC|nr:unnamed protein product [Haemonchus placei]